MPSVSGMNQNQPCVEPEDGDVALELAAIAPRAGEVAVHRRAVVRRVAPLDLEAVRRASVSRPVASTRTSRAIRARCRRSASTLTVRVRRRRRASTSRDARALEASRARAPARCGTGSRRTRSGAPGRRSGIDLSDRLGELERRGVVVPGRDELGALLLHADGVDLVAHAELLEQRQVRRQQRFADVEARMVCLLEQHDVAAALGEQRRGGRARAGRRR